MFKAYLSSLLAVALIVNSVAIPVAQAQDKSQCETALRKIGKALLTFPIPYIPLKEIINDTNKRYYSFVEKPALGFVSTAIGVSIARALSPSDSTWIANFADSYVSYTLKDVVGSGVALQDDLSARQKYWINYLYTVGFYSAVTMSTSDVWSHIGPVLAHPAAASMADINGASYAIGLVTFGLVWPLLSQVVNTTIAPPLLFNRFMQKQDMDAADKTLWPNSQDVYEKYEAQLSLLLNHASAKNIKEAKYLRYRYMWVKWRRDGLQPNDLNPFSGGIVKKPLAPLSKKNYWALKSAVTGSIAASMIVGYFVLRNFVVGTSPEDLGALTNYVQAHISQVRDQDLNAEAQAVCATLTDCSQIQLLTQ